MQSLVYSSVGTWVCVFGILIILHHIITSLRITSHHTSYCIKDTNWIWSWFSANSSSKWKGAKARSKFREIQFYQPCHKKGSLFTKHGYLSLRSMDLFLYKAWKEGKVFFRRRLKNGMCVNFMHRKEINCNNLHIQFNITHSRYYIVLLQ